MGLLDDLRKRAQEALASQALSSAAKAADAALSKVAEDFVGTAEKALQEAEAERGLRQERVAEAAEQAATEQMSVHEQRKAREQRAQQELERLKAAREGEAKKRTL